MAAGAGAERARGARGTAGVADRIVAGQLAGRIEEIEFLPVDGDTSRNLRVRLAVATDLQPQIREDSRAKIRTMGLLGDKTLDISVGTPRFAVLQAGDTIETSPSLDYEQVIAQASGAVGDLVQLTADMRQITGGMVRGEGTVGQLLTNRTMYDQLTQTLAETGASYIRSAAVESHVQIRALFSFLLGQPQAALARHQEHFFDLREGGISRGR